MEKFTNVNIKKERKRITRNLILSILAIIISIMLSIWCQYTIDTAYKNAKGLNEIIVGEDKNKEDKVVYLNARTIPYQFAVQEGNENSFYIVMDDVYMYIAYLSPYNYMELNKEEIKENPIRIQGVTKLISKEIKELALEAYNEVVEEEHKLTMADFDNYFGSVYIDCTVEADNDIGFFQEIGAFIFGTAGFICLIINVIQKIRFNKNVKKLDEYMIEKLDKEMNDSNSFYYEKLHLYLTENYIINFRGTFKAIEYQDIVWMYSMIYRTNGIKTNQSIKVMTKDGKKQEIAVINAVTKTRKEMYEEIWNTILSKNSKMAVGYTKEAEKQAKEMLEK